ncbi:calcium-binding protein [Comamonas aquatica]|uniref:DUF937 domain-containing protein n=1 Tax=Comamonas aquatica TaxID=225991 RepID=UPI0005EC1F15|nr:DUF937 domain-containing protein [Comamonas aquatica]ANY61921.1 calcium-binding protein [Comamonas aquatica]
MHPQQSLVSELMAQLQGAPMQQMAQQLGADRQQIQTAVGAALPLLLGALGRNAAQPQGAADLMGALQRDHAAAMPQGLGGLGDLLGGHILGGSQQQAQDSLGQATGLGGQTAGQLLSMLAPIVMAFLAQRVQAGNMDAGSLGQSLEQERAQAQNAGGLGGGLLGSLLDQDGDGKLGASDLFKLGSAFLNNRR